MDNNKSKSWIASVAIMAGLIFIGAMLPAAVRVYRGFERTVSVKGLCEKEVMADKVIWPIQIKVAGNELASVNRELNAKSDIVRKFLSGGGVSDVEISVTAPIISDKLTQEYGSNDRAFRYVAKSVVTVCSKDVDKVKALIDGQSLLVQNGIAPESEWDNQPEYSFEGLNDIKPAMIEEATKNAREVALKFAKDSGSSLGKIKQASQGTFSIESRDSNTPHIKKVRVVTAVTYYLSK